MTFGSLFAGIGGLDLGFERAGMTCAWQVEIDDYATRVLEKHWPHVRRRRDIRDFPDGDLDEWRVDVICGGFPCQDISYAGSGAGLNGDRSGLFYEAMRVVRALGPRYVVLENVAALLTRGLSEVLGTLASFGFDAEWHCLPAAYFGAPHIRDRAFIVAHHDGPGRERSRRRVQANQNASRGADARDCCPVPVDPAEFAARRDSRQGASRWRLPLTRERCGVDRSLWAPEPALGRVADGIPHRVDRLRGLGNAVVPQVAEWIARRIIGGAA